MFLIFITKNNPQKPDKGKNAKNAKFCPAKNPTNTKAPEVLADYSDSLRHLQTQLPSKNSAVEKGKAVRQWSQRQSGSEVKILSHLGGLLRLQPDQLPACLQPPSSTEVIVRAEEQEKCELQWEEIFVSFTGVQSQLSVMLFFPFSHREAFIFWRVTTELHTHGFIWYLYLMKFAYWHALIIKLPSASLFDVAPKILYSSVALGFGDIFPHCSIFWEWKMFFPSAD